MRNNLFLSILITLFTYQFLINNTNAQSDGDVQLTGSNTTLGDPEHKGLVEIYHDGQWGTICDDGIRPCFPENTVFSVICKQLGYDRVVQGYVSSDGPWGQGTGPTWLDNTECDGTEATVVDCAHSPWGVENCDHLEDISVHCGSCPDDGGCECTDYSDCCSIYDDDEGRYVDYACLNNVCTIAEDLIDTLLEQNNACNNELTACNNELAKTSVSSDSSDENANALSENINPIQKNDNDVESYPTINVELTDSTVWLFCGVFVVVNVCIYLGFYLYNKK